MDTHGPTGASGSILCVLLRCFLSAGDRLVVLISSCNLSVTEPCDKGGIFTMSLMQEACGLVGGSSFGA